MADTGLLPLVVLPLKSTTEIAWDAPLAKQITSVYQDDPARYTREVAALAKLREDMRGAGQVGPDVARDLLLRYYAQLELVDLHFTFNDTYTPHLFRWCDAFVRAEAAQPTLAYEKACVAFNLAAAMSRIAGALPRDTKNAYQALQVASGILQYVADNFLHAPTFDLSASCIRFLSQLMLAQAQEVLYEKTTAALPLNILLCSASIASSGAHFDILASAPNLSDNGASGSGTSSPSTRRTLHLANRLMCGLAQLYGQLSVSITQNAKLSSHVPKVLGQLLQVKLRLYTGLAHLMRTQRLEAEAKYADLIASHEVAAAELKEAAKLASKISLSSAAASAANNAASAITASSAAGSSASWLAFLTDPKPYSNSNSSFSSSSAATAAAMAFPGDPNDAHGKLVSVETLVPFISFVKLASTTATELLAKVNKTNSIMYFVNPTPRAGLPPLDGLVAPEKQGFKALFESAQERLPDMATDIFRSLIPIEIHEKASVYSEHKAQYIRVLREEIDALEATVQSAIEDTTTSTNPSRELDIVHSYLKQTQDEPQHNGDIGVVIPEEVQSLVAEMQGAQGEKLILEMLETMGQVANDVATQTKAVLAEYETEEQKFATHLKQSSEFGYPSSMIRPSEFNDRFYHSLVKIAGDAQNVYTQTLSKAYQVVDKNTSRIKVPEEPKHLPSLRSGKEPSSLVKQDLLSADLEEKAVSETETCLEKVVAAREHLYKIRSSLAIVLRITGSLEKKVREDDISSVLVLNSGQNVEDRIFKTELAKFAPDRDRINEACAFVRKLVETFQEMYTCLKKIPVYRDLLSHQNSINEYTLSVKAKYTETQALLAELREAVGMLVGIQDTVGAVCVQGKQIIQEYRRQVDLETRQITSLRAEREQLALRNQLAALTSTQPTRSTSTAAQSPLNPTPPPPLPPPPQQQQYYPQPQVLQAYPQQQQQYQPQLQQYYPQQQQQQQYYPQEQQQSHQSVYQQYLSQPRPLQQQYYQQQQQQQQQQYQHNGQWPGTGGGYTDGCDYTNVNAPVTAIMSSGGGGGGRGGAGAGGYQDPRVLSYPLPPVYRNLNDPTQKPTPYYDHNQQLQHQQVPRPYVPMTQQNGNNSDNNGYNGFNGNSDEDKNDATRFQVFPHRLNE